MLKKTVNGLFGLLLGLLFFSQAHCDTWQCESEKVTFIHQPSDYYGSGEYFSRCPDSAEQIRCYHYQRHWICQKKEDYFWDRNLESAARTACECPLPQGMAPSSPSISKEPENRFHEFP